jgi:hypothetical protein
MEALFEIRLELRFEALEKNFYILITIGIFSTRDEIKVHCD